MHHPAVASGILDLGTEQRRPGVLGPVVAHQRGQGGRSQQRRVAREHDHVLIFVVVVIGQPGQPDRQGVAGTRLGLLFDELNADGVRCVLHQRFGHPIGPMPDHHDDPGDVDFRHGIEHVQDHGAPAEQVEGLGPLRSHAGAFACGQDHCRKPSMRHRVILNTPERPHACMARYCAPA